MRSKAVLILAVIMGLLTTFLFIKYMKKFDEAAVINTNMTDVVVAKQPIKRNTVIDAGAIEIAQVPKKALHPEAVLTIEEAAGKIANSDLAPGEMLLSHHLQGQKEEALLVSRKVTDGYRAVSVGVNIVRSVSNLIEPDDYVDVISNQTDKQSNGPLVSTLILQHARVLAVGRRMVEATTETPYVEYSSVTLEVKPQDAVALVNASEAGSVSLMLYSRIQPNGETESKGAGGDEK
ncbi:Flp pilus assembly protein CpaB [Paenibacillus hexagrammi]|uniref:Flp pilus assembly protein CpaB n=1 Tax=Paenibacillus hexagrammi TaxID=2908839 RepID=A0ABY3SI68_9BACL|nr:Flp pilus assembly protein CpaB [Paenibacillus sp. YPD9-1]UJF32836.1 Flp pilus assembly protein CpaB [Paenibacillus sp. YPD9-1]